MPPIPDSRSILPMIKRTLIQPILLLLGIWLLSGCVTQRTPEAAAFRQFSFPPAIQSTYRVVAIEDSSTGKFVVIAPDPLPPTTDYPKLIYVFVERNWAGWQGVHTGYIHDDPVAENKIITVQRHSVPPTNAELPTPAEQLDRVRDPFVIGRSDDLDPRVAAVEVTFDDGQTLRDNIDQGVYAVINPDADIPCAITFLDADNNVVPGIEWHGPALPHNCPPS